VAARRAFLGVGLVLVVLLVVQTVNRQWSTDVWIHQATVETFRHDLTDPPNELTLSDAASPSYTPYTFALAVGARATGLASVTVLQLAAVGNVVLFLVSFFLFVTGLTKRRNAACFALLATLVLWGIGPWRWSGILNLNSIGFGLPYPSMFATGLAFLVGWAVLRYDDTGSGWWLVAVWAGSTTIALSHPFTAVWTAVMLLALFVHRRLYRRARLVPLAVTAVVIAAVVAIWPYYSFLDLMTSGDAYTGVHDALYERIPLRILAALPGFYVVLRRFQRDHTDPLALMLFGALLLYAYGVVVDDTNFGRVLPLVLFPAHVGVGVLVADMVDHRARPRPALVAWLGVAAVIGIVGVAPAFVRFVPRAILPASVRDRSSIEAISEPYDALEGALPRGSIVVAETPALARVAPGYGVGTVAPGFASPFVDDLAARRAATAEYLDPATPEAARRALADRYDVAGVLCATDPCEVEFLEGEPGGAPVGDVVARGPSWVLVAVPR
jgi:hypothetical protein